MSPEVIGVFASVAMLTMFAVLLNAQSVALQFRVRTRIYRSDQQLVAGAVDGWRGLRGVLPTRVLLIATVVIAFALLLTVGAIPAVIAALGGAIGSRVARSISNVRSTQRYEKAIPLALDSMARSVRSGSGFLAAVDEAATAVPGPVGADLAKVAHDVALGASLQDALERWQSRRPIAGVHMTVSALTLALETGGAQAQVIDSVSTTLRAQLDAAAAASSAATDSKMSAGVLTVLPLVVSGPVLVLSEPARAFMFHNPFGVAMLVAGLACNGIGALVMSRMVARATS